jgi:hypothetical protein
MSHPAGAISHWYHLFEGYSTPAKEFYTKVEMTVRRRRIPGIAVERIDYAEGGFASANREYLRVRRARLAFDICAAPFGTGYFFSWWLTLASGPWRTVILCDLLVDGLIGLLTFRFLGLAHPVAAVLIVGLTFHLLFMLFSRCLGWRARDVVYSIPLLGPALDRFLNPDTYYKLDTALMYQETVRRAMMEVLSSLQNEKGMRALSPEEQMPRLRDLAK